MKDITIDDLEVCDWEEATHVIVSRGKVITLSKDDHGDFEFPPFSFSSTELLSLGFTPYRLKPVKTYTFMEAIQEPGEYREMINASITINVNPYLKVRFSIGGSHMDWIDSDFFNSTYTKVSE